MDGYTDRSINGQRDSWGGINGQIDVIILYLGYMQELFKLVRRKEKSFVSFIFINLIISFSLSHSNLAGDTIIDGRYTHEEVWFSN